VTSLADIGLATFIMLGAAGIALAIGVTLLVRSRRGSEAGMVVRRMSGTMLTALGVLLVIFAVGLAGRPGAA
jgi:hypothetical protein